MCTFGYRQKRYSCFGGFSIETFLSGDYIKVMYLIFKEVEIPYFLLLVMRNNFIFNLSLYFTW